MNISIIGGGWLGQPLALALAQHHRVCVSKRNPQDCAALSSTGLRAYPYNLGDNLTASSDLLDNCDLVILNIPPGRNSFNSAIFVGQMEKLLSQIHRSGVKHLLFISTTAVYGERARTVYEYSQPEPHTQSAKAHVLLEHTVTALFQSGACTLRLAGLIGEKRHPVNHLAGRKQLKHANRRVNLVHRNDVIAAIDAIVQGQHFGHTFHLSATQHPSRKTYYCLAAQQKGLPLPEFDDDVDGDIGKQIDPSLTLNQLNLALQYSNPDMMID